MNLCKLYRNYTAMEWDRDGDVLCSVCEKSSSLHMWDANQKKVIKVESGAKDTLTFLSWSKNDLHLAVGKVILSTITKIYMVVKK